MHAWQFAVNMNAVCISCKKVCVVTQGGERVARRGYWGDIVNSPYISLGLESDNRDLFQTSNTKHTKVIS